MIQTITKYFNWFTVSLVLWLYIIINFWNGVLVSAWLPFIASMLIVVKLAYNGVVKKWI